MAIQDFLPILQQSNPELIKIHDYGSGPEPVLAHMLVDRGFSVCYSDLYFAPQEHTCTNNADILICLEVCEHFKNPRKDFQLMVKNVRAGGFVVIGTHTTQIFSETEAAWDYFKRWWYPHDPTHISFYSEKGLQIVALAAALEYIGNPVPHMYVFRKQQEM